MRKKGIGRKKSKRGRTKMVLNKSKIIIKKI